MWGQATIERIALEMKARSLNRTPLEAAKWISLDLGYDEVEL